MLFCRSIDPLTLQIHINESFVDVKILCAETIISQHPSKTTHTGNSHQPAEGKACLQGIRLYVDGACIDPPQSPTRIYEEDTTGEASHASTETSVVV